MRFPNGFKGVSKVFTAEILGLIANVLVAVIAGVGVASLAAMASEDTMESGFAGLGVSLILTIVVSILLIIALILRLVGLSQAGKDETAFRTAFIMSIFVLVLVIVNAILSATVGQNSIMDEVVDVVQRIFNIIVIFLVISGVQNFAVRLGNEKMLNRGSSVAWLIALPYILAAIANILVLIFKNNEAMANFAAIMALVAGVLSIIGSIVYVVYLGQAKKMLKEE